MRKRRWLIHACPAPALLSLPPLVSSSYRGARERMREGARGHVLHPPQWASTQHCIEGRWRGEPFCLDAWRTC
eukprot:11055583-Alexandrium_andersonii.AAC.1